MGRIAQVAGDAVVHQHVRGAPGVFMPGEAHASAQLTIYVLREIIYPGICVDLALDPEEAQMTFDLYTPETTLLTESFIHCP